MISLDDDEWDGSQNFSVVLDTSGSSDAAYSGMSTTSLLVVNVDNDGPGLTVISGKMALWEHGGVGHFRVVLNTPPDDTVALTVGCTDETEALISTCGGAAGTTAALQFTPSNWSMPQRVNLIGQDDDLMNGNRILDLNVSVNTAATWDTTGYLTAEPATATINVKDGETIGVDVRIARMCGG